MKREGIPINILRFSLKDSSDEDSIFAGLKTFFACSYAFKFVIE